MSPVSSLPACAGPRPQNGRTPAVASSPDEAPDRTSPAFPETLSENARLRFCSETPPPDRPRSGQQPPVRALPSSARLPPKGRKRGADTRSPAAAKSPPPAEYLSPFPPVGLLPSPQPSTISGSAAGSVCRPRGAERTAWSIRGSYGQSITECPRPTPSSPCCAPAPHTLRPGRNPYEKPLKSTS